MCIVLKIADPADCFGIQTKTSNKMIDVMVTEVAKCHGGHLI